MTDMTLFTGAELKPDYQITAKDKHLDKDITSQLAPRLITLTHIDNSGFEADSLELELDDADGLLELPNRGAELTLKLGWHGKQPNDKGRFIVDEIEHVGTPDRITVRARSADFRDSLNTRREQSWHDTTLGQIIEAIANKNNLIARTGADLASQRVDHIDQTTESDVSFLARLAKQYGASVAVKEKRLIFARPGKGKTVSGEDFTVLSITRSAGDQHRFSVNDRNAYTGVTASWQDTRKPEEKKKSTVKRKTEADPPPTVMAPTPQKSDPLVGSSGNVFVLNRPYKNKASAEQAAKATWDRIQRGVAQFSINLAIGREDLYAARPVRVSGFKSRINEAEWIIKKVTNKVDSNGFTTVVELEVKVSDSDIEPIQ